MSTTSTHTFSVYLEVGRSRTIASALDWPGWCRVGRNPTAALGSLLEHGPRYARIIGSARLGFRAPKDISALVLTEHLKGNATTDFGVPGLAPTGDSRPLPDDELRRLQALLRACWRAFDATAEMAMGKALRTGPRGGGRGLAGIVEHVLLAEGGYLSSLGGKIAPSADPELSSRLVREAILATLEASAKGEIPERGPRGGKRWSPRYFVRREAWHVLDHVWEIENRLTASTE